MFFTKVSPISSEDDDLLVAIPVSGKIGQTAVGRSRPGHFRQQGSKLGGIYGGRMEEEEDDMTLSADVM
ncbi:hypothetical protein HU200_063124 [Digitaria exilis]|uniref:Uncharacterized protein n=1 Tax=Digitaria exilis TaxID=1010633 RepID=A0A835DVE5_9POAL|nr:hypothetical protein HU200_063124 [Digitaria exilis]